MATREYLQHRSFLLILLISSMLVAILVGHGEAEAAPPKCYESGFSPEIEIDLTDCPPRESATVSISSSVNAGTVQQEGAGANESNGSPSRQAPGCRFNGHEIPCSNAVGYWSNRVEAWCTLRVPQPPLSDSAWGGNTTGAIYLCTRPAHSGIPDPAMVVTRWLPAAPEAPDPETIAWRILAELDLESPELGVFPRGDSAQRMGFVGWNVWLWAAADSDRQWGPVSASQSEGGVSVSLTARVTSMTWDMGNGDTVSCGKGTAWTLAATGGKNVASPTCGYVYEADGRYTVRGSSTWEVAWSGGGQLGTIPLTLSREAEVIVGELQAVTVNR